MKLRTPEQLNEAVSAYVESGGNAAQAARTLGQAVTTLKDTLRQARNEGLLDNPLKDKQKNEAAKLKNELRKSRHIIEQQQEEIAQLKSKRFKLPKAPKVSGKGSFRRVIITDTHGCRVNEPAFAAVVSDLASIQPKEIVLLGDHLDAAGWLSKHHPFKTVEEARYSFSEDKDAANTHLDLIQQAAPKAKIYYLEGNHEERLESFCVESTKQHPVDAAYLCSLFSPQSVLHLEKRGIEYFRRTDKHQGMRRRGIIRLGKCYFVHGLNHTKNAAAKHLEQVKHNVVFGHVHRPMESPAADSWTEYRAWCPGCLCEFEPIWKHSEPTDWGHGYGVQAVSSNGDFLHLNVPIVRGKSLFQPFIRGMG